MSEKGGKEPTWVPGHSPFQWPKFENEGRERAAYMEIASLFDKEDQMSVFRDYKVQVKVRAMIGGVSDVGKTTEEKKAEEEAFIKMQLFEMLQKASSAANQAAVIPASESSDPYSQRPMSCAQLHFGEPEAKK